MDSAAQPSDLMHRAASPEPSSTRPNPFDDSDTASRKRRRTSGSVESVNRLPENSSTNSTLDEDDQRASVGGTKMDRSPATPRTPEPSSSGVRPTDPPSSKVTINLRDFPSDTMASSLPSRTDLSEAVSDDHDGIDRAADLDGNLVQSDLQASQSVSSGPESPPVELIQESDDDDIDLEAPVGAVCIMDEDRYVADPTQSFPYRDPQEALSDTVHRLVQYISIQPLDLTILGKVGQWLDRYLQFVDRAGPPQIAPSLRFNRDFWMAYPDILFAMFSRSPPLHKTPDFRSLVMKFYSDFIQLTVHLVQFDIHSARETQASLAANERHPPDLFSGPFLNRLHLLMRREAMMDDEQTLEVLGTPGSHVDDSSILLAKVEASFGDSVGCLDDLATAFAEILPTFPRLTGSLGCLSQVLTILMDEAATVTQSTGNEQAQAMMERLERGHQLWLKVSACLTVLIEKHVTQLSNEAVTCAISALSECLKHCLAGTHKLATDMVEEHQRIYPQLPSAYTPDAAALEWRFDMLGRLIRCSQMQLRVMGITTMCSELVDVWKRFGEDADAPILKHVGHYVLRSNLVEYILGPNCHPEIIVESANIVGFLVVTKMYRKEHTDRLWEGITSNQYPRVADALARMITTITNLFDYASLSELCQKFEEFPISGYTPSVRSLWSNLMRQMALKSGQDRLSYQPYGLCLRLLRESSVCTNGSQVAHPDMQLIAMQEFKDLLSHGPDLLGRAELYQSCLTDVSQKSHTTLGSLWCLSMAIRPKIAQEIQVLAKEHDLTRLIVEELETAARPDPSAKGSAVLCGSTNQPRRDFVANIISYQPISITDDLGKRLWDVLVGPRSLCHEDREAGWKILNDIVNTIQCQNPYIRACVSRYLPALPASCFCEGLLEFVKQEALALVDKNEDFQLDNEMTVRSSCLEQLWRIVLKARDLTLSARAIHILAVDVYMDSDLLSSYPPQRTRQVHSSLVNRCFAQLKESARKIRASNDGVSSGDDESMVIVTTDDQMQEHERTFSRSLQLLRYFLEGHQSKPQFAAPDLRALMSRSPSGIAGDLTQLKYQSFDGVQQTDVKPLNIGRQNSAASLLSSIRQETGFQNYRAFFRGQTLMLTEQNVCKSLEDLHIDEGLILVRREHEEDGLGSFKVKPGSTSLQIEILSHFQEMWTYLNMKEKLAREIYNFLIQLPADVGVMESFEDEATSYTDIFPPGQPFRSLYAVHALHEYKNFASRSRFSDEPALKSKEDMNTTYMAARKRLVSLIVQAILDPNVVSHSIERLQMQLTGSLMCILVPWLQDPDLVRDRFDATVVGIYSPNRFIRILSNAMASSDESSMAVIIHTFSAVLQLGLLDSKFWEAVALDGDFHGVARSLILFEKRKQVRGMAIKLIQEFADREDHLISVSATDHPSHHAETPHRIARLFWTVALGLVPDAVTIPDQCHELFTLAYFLMCKVFIKWQHLIDLRALAAQTSNLLVSHESTEDIDQLEPFDPVPRGLASLLQICLQIDGSIAKSEILSEDLVVELFWRHLFPRTRELFEQPVPKVILNTDTRSKICEIIFLLVKHDRPKFGLILKHINELVPYFPADEDEPYLYDIPGSFDRSKSMRAPCGYVGLRNLSNTCYLNSLLAQLFMNTGFRRFIMSTKVHDPESTQELLYYTKKTFGFMQESYRRFVDPTNLVASIKTYEDSLIDIHNQMDVDEFYNLLFDRWEGQLLSSLERKQLRSFYGGQLVQQVKSKECEHISERLEPFSAIQCEVKGKRSLQESLQAYVDGEVLEGDNKYKCSTCDRHVDAVKRTCLKDLPDHIILHLKRFDFNLRDMQRSKINDYFAFPDKIDLMPYSVEHLTDPTTEGKDIFELVGVLVHAGTAESGHYYSYIRERPSGPGRPSWVEFNDDNVTPWDPALMESATFGGPDHRPPFDGTGVTYDKPYCAYMLFYERASSLREKEEEIMKQGTPIPVHVDVEGPQKEHISDENTNLLRRHCLFDPTHAGLVLRFFSHTMELDNPEFAHSELTVDEDKPAEATPPEEGSLKELAMEAFLSHLDQVVSRKKDLPDLASFMRTLGSAIQQSPESAYSFYEYFYLRPAAFRSLLQRNPDPLVRQHTSHQFLLALKKIAAELPQYYASTPSGHVDSGSRDFKKQEIGRGCASGRHGVPVLGGVMYIFRHLWRYFQFHIRAWDEHFGTILGFAKLGDRETAHLLADDYLMKLIRIIAADQAMDLPGNYARMLHNILRRLNNRPPSYLEIIATIDYLLMQLAETFGPESIVESPRDRLHLQQRPFAWTSPEVSFVHYHPERLGYSFFVEKLLVIDQLPQSTDRIVTRLAKTSDQMDHSVAQVLKVNISRDSSSQPLDSFFRLAVEYLNCTRNESRAENLVAHIAAEARHLHVADIPAMVSFFQGALNLGRLDRGFAKVLRDYCVELMPVWSPPVLVHPSVDVRLNMAGLHNIELFQFTLNYGPSNDDEERQKHDVVVDIIGRLRESCLFYIREAYVRHEVPVGREPADSIMKTIRKCGQYYEAQSGMAEDAATEFRVLQDEVIMAFRKLVVEQTDDDGTDWDASCASSDQMEGITAEMNMQAMNELNDTDVA